MDIPEGENKLQVTGELEQAVGLCVVFCKIEKVKTHRQYFGISWIKGGFSIISPSPGGSFAKRMDYHTTAHALH